MDTGIRISSDAETSIKYQEIQVLKSIYSEDFIDDNDSEFCKIKIKVDIPEGFTIKTKIVNGESQESSIDSNTTTSTTATQSNNTNVNGHKHIASSDSSITTTERSFPFIILPNITLGFEFPQDYPASPPTLMLSSCWLTINQMNLIIKELDSIWEADQPIIFKYIEWIKQNVITFIQERFGSVSDNCIYFTDEHQDLQSPLCDFVEWEHQSGWINLLSSLPLLLANNLHEMRVQFQHTSHCCPICYTDYEASEFEMFACSHFICKGCVGHIIKVNIENKSLKLIKCSEPNCNRMIDQNIVKKYTTEEQFKDYIGLNKQSEGYTKCTRCSGWAKIDQISRSTFCEECYYSMCMMCGKDWHPAVGCNLIPMRTGAKITEEDYEIKKNSRPCPGCSITIWKYDGCNKVICTNCSNAFCWLCLRVISGYEHFNQSCILFEIPHTLRGRKAAQQNWEGVVTATASCIRCKSRLYQYNRNNHLFCQQCKGEMCYICQKSIIGTKHFQSSSCNQHGGDPIK